MQLENYKNLGGRLGLFEQILFDLFCDYLQILEYGGQVLGSYVNNPFIVKQSIAT